MISVLMEDRSNLTTPQTLVGCFCPGKVCCTLLHNRTIMLFIDFQGSSSRRHDYPSSSRDSRSRSRERTFSRGYKRTSSHCREDVDFDYSHASEKRQMRSHWNNDDDKASPDRQYIVRYFSQDMSVVMPELVTQLAKCNFDRDYPNQAQARPYETQEPNRTVMVQGLGPEVTENQVSSQQQRCG